MSEPRAYTADEVRDKLLDHVRALARYWAASPDKSPLERCEGVAFSILALLDGSHCGIPGFDLYPSQHPDDKAYHAARGENWYDEDVLVNDCQLHELFYR